MTIDLDEVTARQSRLESAVASFAEMPWDDLPTDVVDSLLTTLESAQRTLPTLGGELILRLRREPRLKRVKRLRTHLANLLHISATDAGARIAMAADLAGDQPTLPEAAAAARHGLVGPEHLRIMRDTIAKLPDTASDADRARFDLELTGVAVSERPEVLRRDAALLLAEFDATRDDPVTRERSRAARRDFVLGPQDADGMSRGRFCLDPEARAYLEIVLAKLGRPGMCNADDPIPTVDGDPDATAAAGDTRTTAQRNHDAVRAALRGLLASGDLGQHRGLPVTAIVTMTLQDLESASGLALTGGGSTVPVEDAIRMAAHAHHYLYVYDGTTGRPLFLGRSKRLASADQRIVLHAIDRGCTVPGCDQPAYNCEVHHLIEWSPDGTTDIDRLTLTCQDGNLSAGPTDDEWQARRRYDVESLGQTLWYPPKSVDPSRQPRANRFHRRPNRPHPEPDAA
ncbi:HNH endonuclease signature motif containing protein [Mycolicibacterium sp. YH-1]|uniref:HNH endonuclease signature motif containing protein n=1 Tax=Mycolicibacterium sp. YH-1 TaxID=2908837 RepID=UPI001F4C4B5B|nr:HNH endonuclease signature motif containing protein [Mycolicibacterium sp. YH-1]UNB50621.1 HNH endonuclease [Mycolicibacterium sp. YH-1]